MTLHDARRTGYLVRRFVAAVDAVLILVTLISAPSAVQAWDASVYLETTTVQPGSNTHISANVQNTWSRDIYMNSARLSIDWAGSPNNQSASGRPRGLEPGTATTIQ